MEIVLAGVVSFWQAFGLYSLIIYLGYPLKYNEHKYSRVFDLVSWIISALPYIAFPAADRLSYGIFEGTCKEVSKEYNGMVLKWLEDFIYGALILICSLIEWMKLEQYCTAVYHRQWNIFCMAKNMKISFFRCVKKNHGRINYEKYLLHFVSDHKWISVKSCLGLVSTTIWLWHLIYDTYMITIVSLMRASWPSKKIT